jgi:hypothetical protein
MTFATDTAITAGDEWTPPTKRAPPDIHLDAWLDRDATAAALTASGHLSCDARDQSRSRWRTALQALRTKAHLSLGGCARMGAEPPLAAREQHIRTRSIRRPALIAAGAGHGRSNANQT